MSSAASLRIQFKPCGTYSSAPQPAGTLSNAAQPALHDLETTSTRVVPGDRVVLQGLVKNPELNGRKGTVWAMKAERAVVNMDCGRRVSTKLYTCLPCERAEGQPVGSWGSAA